MTKEEIEFFMESLNHMQKSREEIDYVREILPEFNGNEAMINALNQARYWVGFAIQCWGLQGKNIIDYNSKEWLEVFMDLEK